MNRILQEYSQSIQAKSSKTFSEHLERESQKTVLAIFDDPRMEDLELEKYSCPQSAYIDIATKGENVKLGAVAKHLSFVDCTSSPSLQSLLSAGFLQIKNVIILITLFIDRLSKFFEKPTTKSAEELAWMIYEEYKDLSIEDLIKFFDLCKRKYFSNEYQHVSSRGVNADFILDWLDKYMAITKEERQLAVKKFRDRAEESVQGLTAYDKAKLDEIGNKRREKSLRKQKIIRLREEYEMEEHEKPLRQRMLEFISDEVLWFTDDYCLRKREERMEMARKRVEVLFGGWSMEFEKYFSATVSTKHQDSKASEKGGDYEKGTNRPTLTCEKYVNAKIKPYIHGKKTEIEKRSPKSIFQDGLSRFVKEKKVQNGNELLMLLDRNHCVKNKCEPSEIIPKIASHLLEKTYNSYLQYVNENLESEDLPLKKVDYMLKQAHLWVVQNCYVKTNNTNAPNGQNAK